MYSNIRIRESIKATDVSYFDSNDVETGVELDNPENDEEAEVQFDAYAVHSQVEV